jgi:hypothetical protein
VNKEKWKEERPGEKLGPDLKKIEINGSLTGKDLRILHQCDRLTNPNTMDEEKDPRKYGQCKDAIPKNKFSADQ